MAVGGRTAGNEDGQFSISNYIFDSAHNGSNAHTNLNYVDNGVIIGFHCAGSLIMKNCRFDTADTGTAKIVDVKCSSAVNQRFISLEGCYRKNYTSALDWSAESTWDSWIDGTVAFTVIFNGIVLSPD